MNKKVEYTLTELTRGLDVTLQGNPEAVISGVSPIQQANAGHLSFLTNMHYRKYLATTNAAAVVLGKDDAAHYQGNAVICRNPYYVYAKMAAYFAEEEFFAAGIHSTAVVGSNTMIDPSASIGANCVIGNHVKIGKDVVISPGCIIGDDVEIDDNARLDANVTLYRRVKVGKRTHLFSGVVIGSAGFGFANEQGAWHTVPQLGSVVLGDDVSIGANTTIDRGAIEDTIIEDGAKLDNLIQVGHNVRIGKHTIIAGCVAIAGSTTIGAHCMIGGATCFAGHINICDKTMITGMTAVTKSITEPGIYSSGIVGAVPNHEFRKNNARFHRMENLIQRVKELESTVKAMTKREEV